MELSSGTRNKVATDLRSVKQLATGQRLPGCRPGPETVRLDGLSESRCTFTVVEHMF